MSEYHLLYTHITVSTRELFSFNPRRLVDGFDWKLIDSLASSDVPNAGRAVSKSLIPQDVDPFLERS
jgi:hypothetical protein